MKNAELRSACASVFRLKLMRNGRQMNSINFQIFMRQATACHCSQRWIKFDDVSAFSLFSLSKLSWSVGAVVGTAIVDAIIQGLVDEKFAFSLPLPLSLLESKTLFDANCNRSNESENKNRFILLLLLSSRRHNPNIFAIADYFYGTVCFVHLNVFTMIMIINIWLCRICHSAPGDTGREKPKRRTNLYSTAKYELFLGWQWLINLWKMSQHKAEIVYHSEIIFIWSDEEICDFFAFAVKSEWNVRLRENRVFPFVYRSCII